MKITVKVHPKSSQNKVIEVTGSEFEVYTNAAPQKNKANKALVELLAAYFDLPKSAVNILAGHTSKAKIVEVLK